MRCATPCFCRPAALVRLLALRFLVSARLLAVRWCLSPPAPAPPKPNTPHPSACCSLPPLCFLVSPRLPAVVAAPPPRCWRPAPRFSLFTLCLVVALRRFALCPCLLPFLPRPRVCALRVLSRSWLLSSVLPLPSRGFGPLGRLPPPPSWFSVSWVSSPCCWSSRVLLMFPCYFHALGLGTCLVGFLFPRSAGGPWCALWLASWCVPPPPPPGVAPGGVR